MPPSVSIDPGDEVTVSPIARIKGAVVVHATVVSLPTQQFPYWIFQTTDEVIYAEAVIVSKKL